MNVLAVDPNIIVDLKYATTDNFTHQMIYDFTTAVARTGTVKKLGIASRLLYDQGYRLKIWDAFRPVTAQAKLFSVVSDPMWVAEPNPNYSHQKGVTFDLTLTDLDGHEVEMQSLLTISPVRQNGQRHEPQFKKLIINAWIRQ